ncbi:MAG: hypothetical protein H8K10_10395 [Nitrospira sp.]|nr:hypothetical protein [Nitrospira sp.]
MNLRLVLTFVALGFIVLLLIIGIRTAVRWLKIHFPQRANAVLFGVCLLLAGAGWLIAVEMEDQPTFRPNDLLTLQEPVVAKTIMSDRESRSTTCVVDLHEHLGLLELENERGTMRARVESNNTAEPLYCPIGAEVRIEAAWLHHPTITHRQADTDGL